MAVAFDLNASYEDLLIQKLTNVPAQDKRETSLIYQPQQPIQSRQHKYYSRY